MASTDPRLQDLTHLPQDIAEGIAAYDAACDSGQISWQDNKEGFLVRDGKLAEPR